MPLQSYQAVSWRNFIKIDLPVFSAEHIAGLTFAVWRVS
jgi:hypothetical protein